MYSRDRSNHSMSIVYSTTSNNNNKNEASNNEKEHISRRSNSSTNVNNNNNSISHNHNLSMIDSDAQSLPQGTFAIKAGPQTIMSQWVVTLDDGDDDDEDDEGEDGVNDDEEIGFNIGDSEGYHKNHEDNLNIHDDENFKMKSPNIKNNSNNNESGADSNHQNNIGVVAESTQSSNIPLGTSNSDLLSMNSNKNVSSKSSSVVNTGLGKNKKQIQSFPYTASPSGKSINLQHSMSNDFAKLSNDNKTKDSVNSIFTNFNKSYQALNLAEKNNSAVPASSSAVQHPHNSIDTFQTLLNQILSDSNNLSENDTKKEKTECEITDLSNRMSSSLNKNYQNLSHLVNNHSNNDSGSVGIVNDLTQIKYLKPNYNIQYYPSDFMNFSQQQTSIPEVQNNLSHNNTRLSNLEQRPLELENITGEVNLATKTRVKSPSLSSSSSSSSSSSDISNKSSNKHQFVPASNQILSSNLKITSTSKNKLKEKKQNNHIHNSQKDNSSEEYNKSKANDQPSSNKLKSVKSLTNLYESKLNLSSNNYIASYNVARNQDYNGKSSLDYKNISKFNNASGQEQLQQQQSHPSYSTTSTNSSSSSQKPIHPPNNHSNSLDLNNNHHFTSRSLGTFIPQSISQYNDNKANSNTSGSNRNLPNNDNVETTSFKVKNVIKLLEDSSSVGNLGYPAITKNENYFLTGKNNVAIANNNSQQTFAKPKRSSSIDNVISMLNSESLSRNSAKNKAVVTGQKPIQDSNSNQFRYQDHSNNFSLNKVLEGLGKNLGKNKNIGIETNNRSKSLHRENNNGYLEINNFDNYDFSHNSGLIGNLSSAYNIANSINNNINKTESTLGSASANNNVELNGMNNNGNFNVIPKPPPGQPPQGYQHRLRRFRANVSTSGTGNSNNQQPLPITSGKSQFSIVDSEAKKADNATYKKLLDEIDNKYNNQYQNNTKLF